VYLPLFGGSIAKVSLSAGISHIGSARTRSERQLLHINQSLCGITSRPTDLPAEATRRLLSSDHDRIVEADFAEVVMQGHAHAMSGHFQGVLAQSSLSAREELGADPAMTNQLLTIRESLERNGLRLGRERAPRTALPQPCRVSSRMKSSRSGSFVCCPLSVRLPCFAIDLQCDVRSDYFSSLIRMLRNSTAAPWPRKPM